MSLRLLVYWTVDDPRLGGRRYIGSPEQSTLSVDELIEGEYQIQQFRGSDCMISAAFPELTLTVEQIFAQGQ